MPPPRPLRKHGRVSPDRWLVSYADFITLLFAFFAMLYAISSVDARKLATVADAMQVAFDDSPRIAERAADRVLPDEARFVPDTGDSTDVQAVVARDLAAELASDRLELIVDRRGVILSIPEAGTFSSGHDALSATARDLVSRIATTVLAFPNPVRVEGHTDDRPISNVRFRSNWDLSAARASRVVELLIQRGVSADRMSATGYAEFHPRDVGDSDVARARNRRVDLVILNAGASAAEEPAGDVAGP